MFNRKKIKALENTVNKLKEEIFIIQNPFKFKVGQNVYLKNDHNYIKVKIINPFICKGNYWDSGLMEKYYEFMLKSTAVGHSLEHDFITKKKYKKWKKYQNKNQKK